MKGSRAWWVPGIVLLLAACSEIQAPDDSVAVQTFWLPAEGAHSFDCAYECAAIRGLSPCHCIQNACRGGDPEAQTCSTPGATCNLIGPDSYEELECRSSSAVPRAAWRASAS